MDTEVETPRCCILVTIAVESDAVGNQTIG